MSLIQTLFGCVIGSRRPTVKHSLYILCSLGPDSFYTTNDRYFQNDWLALVEGLYPLKLSNVVFSDGSHAKSVVEDFQMANGINIDASGK